MRRGNTAIEKKVITRVVRCGVILMPANKAVESKDSVREGCVPLAVIVGTGRASVCLPPWAVQDPVLVSVPDAVGNR